MKSKIIAFLGVLILIVGCQSDEDTASGPVITTPPSFTCFDKTQCVDLAVNVFTANDWELCARSLKDVATGEETTDLILDLSLIHI